ncbi:MAG: hypothetical protein Q4G33_03220 [bacterium]|nr:hypothetical protein [bacterium]
MKKNIIIIVLAFAAFISGGMNIKSYKERKHEIYQYKISLQSELANALTELNVEYEQSYNNAMTHFYAANKIISCSEAFPQESKRTAVCDFLWAYGSRYPEVFKQYIPELTALHEQVVALDINSEGQKKFNEGFMRLYSELDEIVSKIGNDISAK